MKLLFITLLVLISATLLAQVNLQNGSATYSIPIFSFSDSKSSLNTSISLNYSSGNGLVVSSKAGNTGEGWALLAGGAIYRKQHGEPDDQNSSSSFPVMPMGSARGFISDMAYYDADYQSGYSPNPSDTYSRNYIDNYFPNGFIYSEFPLDMVEPTSNNAPLPYVSPREIGMMPRFTASMDKKYMQSRRALTDREQDVFVYNFNGLSGEFVIGKDGNIQLLNDSKIQIQKNTADLTNQNIRTTITEFIIRDGQGIDYKFSAYDLSEVMNPTEIASYGIPAFTYKIMSSSPTGKYTISKWLLTEMVNSKTLEKITFNYETYDVNDVTSLTPTYQNTVEQFTETVQIMENKAKGKIKRIKEILFPDGHKLEFSYDLITQGIVRHDFPDDYPLNKIKLTYNNEEKFTYTFNYGYFLRKEIKDIAVYPSQADIRFTRLCLKSLVKSGLNNMSEPAYKFSYYTGSESSDPKEIVPPYDCLSEDHWGYYTKNSNVDLNSPITKEIIKDLLTNSSTYRQTSPGSAALGLLKGVEFPLGGKLTYEYEQNEAKDADNPSVTKIMGGVRVAKTILSDGISSNNNIVTNYYYKDSDGTTSGWGYETSVYLTQKEIKVWNAGNLNGYTNAGVMKVPLAESIAKGLFYHYVPLALVNMTGAILGATAPISIAPPVYAFIMVCIGSIQRLIILFNPIDYIHTNTYNFNSYQSQNPIGVNYSKVEVVNTSAPGGFGKTIYEFTAPLNVRNEISSLAFPYSAKTRYPAWKYGLPLKTKVYNQTGVLLKESVNTYNIISNSINNDNNKSCRVDFLRAHSAACYNSTGDGAVPLSDFVWEYYYPLSGRAELTNTSEITYSSGGLTAQTNNVINYNNDYSPKTVTTTKSNGDVLIVKKYYANDYNNISAGIQEMKATNMLSIPVSTETWLVKPNTNEYLLDATVNEFIVHSNGEIKLNKAYKLETKEPLLKSIIGYQDPAFLIRNSTYFKEVATLVYDNDGLLKETYNPAGKFSTHLYDFNKRVITATISNAHVNEVAYSSFETSEKGNWIFDISNVTNGDAVMGNKYFHFGASSSATITKLWTIGKDGRLSFWQKGASPIVNFNSSNLSPVKVIANTETGWTFYEYLLIGSGTVSVSNNSTVSFLDIDELRLCPKESRMETVAYDPIVGKTSVCDINNKINYYEYDGLDRLIHIRDEKKNIIKKICYNFSGEPENCFDPTDTSPQWRYTGETMCQQCGNTIYNSGVKLRKEVDVNPYSNSNPRERWVVDPTSSCPSPPDWSLINTYCNQTQGLGGGNDGNQIFVYTDLNPCSPTYNTTQTTSVYNTAACPLPPKCIPACSEPEYLCINEVCVQGTWECISSVMLTRTEWVCTYAYCFPGGQHSTYTTQVSSSSACTVTCP